MLLYFSAVRIWLWCFAGHFTPTEIVNCSFRIALLTGDRSDRQLDATPALNLDCAHIDTPWLLRVNDVARAERELVHGWVLRGSVEQHR